MTLNFNDFVFLTSFNFSIEIQNKIESLISHPYENNGVKRIHIGDPALQVENKIINERIETMKKVGYTSNNYFIEFNDNALESIANSLKHRFCLSHYHYCAILLTPSQCMPVHSDTYSYLMKIMKNEYPSVNYSIKDNGKRYLVFLSNWEQGQSFGAGNHIEGGWKSGDVYEWGHKLPHWSSNASMSPMLFFEITGLKL